MNNLGFGPGNILAGHRANQMRLMQMGRAPSPIGATAPRPQRDMGTQLGQGLGAIGKMLGQFGAQRKAEEQEAKEQHRQGVMTRAAQAGAQGVPAFMNPDNPTETLVPARKPGAETMAAVLASDPATAADAMKMQASMKPTMMRLFHPNNPEKYVDLPEGSPLLEQYKKVGWGLEPGEKIVPELGPQTELGKVYVDLKAGRISEEEAAERKAAILAEGQGDSGGFGNSFQGKALDTYTRLNQIPSSKRTPEQRMQLASATWALQQPISTTNSFGQPVTVMPRNLPNIPGAPSPSGGPPTPASGSNGVPVTPSASADGGNAALETPSYVGAVPPSVQNRVDGLKVVIRNGNGAIQDLKKAMDLSGKAYSGWTAGATRTGARLLGLDDDRVEASTEMEQLVLQTVLPNLKAIFGGNPTEGERAMLLDMNASLSMTRGERKKLLQNALTMVQRRMEGAQADLDATLEGNTLNPVVGDSKMFSATPAEIREVTDISELLAMDPSKMSDEQARAYAEQLKKLMGI